MNLFDRLMEDMQYAWNKNGVCHFIQLKEQHDPACFKRLLYIYSPLVFGSLKLKHKIPLFKYELTVNQNIYHV